MRAYKKPPLKADKKVPPRGHKRGVIGYSKKSALLEDAITQMNAGKYGRSSAALKELLALDPSNMEARRLFATLHLRLGSLLPARQAFESLANEAFERQDYWLAESLLREYLAAGPRCVPFIEKLGSVYQEKGDALAASEELAKAIDILIEDPDHDRPALPTELYAKIRELAPASPPAFRLASLFDAQTGELIARAAIAPSPNQDETLTSSVAVESSESTGSNLSTAMSDPISGVMPWGGVSTGTSELPAQSSQPEGSDRSASSTVELLGAFVTLPLVDESLAPQDVFVDRTPVELSANTSRPSSSSDSSSPAAHNDAGPASVPPLHEKMSDVSIMLESPTSDALPAPLPWEHVLEATVAIPQADEESLPAGLQSAESIFSVPQEIALLKIMPSDESGEKQKEESLLLAGIGPTLSLATTEKCSPDVAWSAPDVVAPGLASSSLPSPSQTISALGDQPSESLAESVPMSWEQIQESPVSIEEFTQESSILAGASPEPLPTQLQEASSAEISDRGISEAIAISPELGSLESHDALSNPTDDVLPPPGGLATSEPSTKIGEFSWASIFNSAWKFGSSSPAPHDSLHHFSPVESSEFAESAISHEAEGAPVLHEERVPAVSTGTKSESIPMSGDQVQDVPITIPFADSVLSIAGDFLKECTVAPVELSEEGVALEVSPLAPVFKDEQTDVAASGEISEIMPASVSLAEPAVSPMPCDQVQDTPITILSAASAMGSAVEPLAMPVAPINIIDETAALDAPQVIAPVEVPAVPAHVCIEELRSLEAAHVESAEASFRFMDSTRAGAESIAVSEVLRAQHPTLPAEPPADSQPPVSSSPADDHSPVHSKRFQIASQAEPSPVVLESVKPSAPVSSAEPALAPSLSPVSVSPVLPIPQTAQDKEEWIRTGEAIRFIDPVAAESVHLMPPPSPAPHDEEPTVYAPSTAASAVDVLFQSSGRHMRTQTTERAAAFQPRPWLSAKLVRVRIGLSVFIGSCFSTTRALVTSIVGLAVLSVAIVAMAIGAVGLTWLVMEEKPSPAFQSLTTPPQRVMMDSGENGYLLLLGFEADAAADPVQAGYERKPDAKDGGMAAVCQGEGEGMTGANQKNASASVAQDWYGSADPTSQFKAQADSLKSWTSQANVSLGRYRQWLKMSFEDWGHGQAVAPPCAAILFAHRLHVAEGFSQGASPEAGIERLEGDMEAWRTTLGQAKTLPIKVMALRAINDDIAVASGLLVKPDFDGKALPWIIKMLRPLDPVESSMRWPMQSQLVLATQSYVSQLDADRGEDIPLHINVAGMLPLPKQRRFNDYAEYYELSYKAAGEGRYSAMPKRSTYIRHPASGVMDYLTNPIENIIGIDPLPAWDHYNGLVIDTDARLRLASLQAWLRRGPQDADLLARIAKAGQRFYDPYTGLPMLVNLRRGVMYSVGHDGKDQDADPQQDVVVSIPVNQPAAAIAKSAPKSK